MTRTLTIIYASSTGHTEFVVDALVKVLKETKELRVVRQRAESSTEEDLRKSGLLLLTCGSWNTGGPEGQMNPWMHDFLLHRAMNSDLTGVQAMVIGLGDERYRFTARAADLMAEWLTSHGASLFLPTLKIINDPFDQAKKIEAWAREFEKKLTALPKKSA